METIRILFYTDTTGFNTEGSKTTYCASYLKRFIKLKLAKIADVEMTVKCRHVDYQTDLPSKDAPTKLTSGLLSDYDELWMFGFGSEGNSEKEPENELTDDEVKNLCDWMKTGGVMVTGDHSQISNDENACLNGADPNTFFSRGFTIGQKIPRAGQLRVWKGPPTNCLVAANEIEKSQTYNTNATGTCANNNLDADCLEMDEFPQRLEGLGQPPHFLFCYDLDENKVPIPVSFFPDHKHEGRALVPDTYDKCWPSRPPHPQVVAKGRDKRFPLKERVYSLVVAYDGDPADVGRIVADSSFHHFLDDNLKKIPAMDIVGSPVPGKPLDQIAQFYANLAYWLAPKTLRDKIKKDIIFRTSIHLNVLETIGNGTHQLGKAAKFALESEIGAANLFRIFEVDRDEREEHLTGGLLTYAITGRGAVGAGFESSGHEYFLGSVIESYHQFYKDEGLNPLRLIKDPTPPQVAYNGVEKALSTQFSLAEGLLTRFREASESLLGGGAAQEKKESKAKDDTGEV